MSLLIKGMEMPSCCGKCEFLTEGLYQGKQFPCICSVGKFPVKPSETDLLDGLCPLVEVKPHGALIDAEVLYAKTQEWEQKAVDQLKTLSLGSNEYNKMLGILNERTQFKHDVFDAPVIIEKEE